MKHPNLTRVLSGSLLLLGSICANAAILAQYEFTGGSTASTDSSVYSAAGAATSASIGGVSNTFTGNQFRMLTPGTETTYNAGSYIEFSTTITGLGANEVINLSSFTFDYAIDQYLGGTWMVGLYSNVGGFDLSGAPLTEETNVANIASHTITYNTDAAGYKGLVNGDVAAFRLYFADANSNSGRRHIVDNVTLNGDVAVIPEPSASLLGVMGVSGLVLLRRKR